MAAPIEQQVNGVEGMLYMSSQCTNDGNYRLTVTFQNGVDLNMAQVLVQNRASLAQPILPDLVKRRGVTVKKKSPNVLMIVNLFSKNGTRDNLYLSNYATIQLKDELSRLKGVGDITALGQRDYSMRLWLDPDKMATRNLTTSDVVRAIEQQNTQVAAGQLGQPPVANGQGFQLTMSTMGRLADIEQFGDMILKTDSAGTLVKLQRCRRTSSSGPRLTIRPARSTASLPWRCRSISCPAPTRWRPPSKCVARWPSWKARFPEGVDYDIVYDTTPFINQSINEVFKTLATRSSSSPIVVLLFLQNWRSALIPLIAVPVAIIGTFVVMALLGFSLNNLTLFGLVLAIGIVVDDAIVVVEAVEHHMEHGLSPREATLEAMRQVSGPVIAVGLVLSAVFVPCAFISGITGQFFRQFALTIAVSTLISAFNSLTLSPALTALLLRGEPKGAGIRVNDRPAPPLPRLAFALAGGWLGWEYLRPWINDNFRAALVFELFGTLSPLHLVILSSCLFWGAGRLGRQQAVKSHPGRFLLWFQCRLQLGHQRLHAHCRRVVAC